MYNEVGLNEDVRMKDKNDKLLRESKFEKCCFKGGCFDESHEC